MHICDTPFAVDLVPIPARKKIWYSTWLTLSVFIPQIGAASKIEVGVKLSQECSTSRRVSICIHDRLLYVMRCIQDDGRVVTLLGRFSWQGEGEMALAKLISTPLTLDGEATVLVYVQCDGYVGRGAIS